MKETNSYERENTTRMKEKPTCLKEKLTRMN